jgi:hypothetical protein
MRFQQRDAQILNAIYDYGGVLSRTQIKEMFWPDKSWRAMEVRLAKLQRSTYIAWPDNNQRQHNAIPQPILWLAARGIMHVAQERGVELELPTRLKESSLRKLEKALRKRGISWLREPPWSKLGHDLTLVDVRRAIEKGAGSTSDMRLGEWIGEHSFRSQPDRISYQLAKKGLVKSYTREVIPDGSFTLLDITRQLEGKPHQARFLLELDMATHSNPNFGRFKVAPYAAYISSKRFEERFGGRMARWLIITTGATRLRNLMAQCRSHAGIKANLFYFATIKDVLSTNPLTHLIWQCLGQQGKVPLIGNRGDHE